MTVRSRNFVPPMDVLLVQARRAGTGLGQLTSFDCHLVPAESLRRGSRSKTVAITSRPATPLPCWVGCWAGPRLQKSIGSVKLFPVARVLESLKEVDCPHILEIKRKTTMCCPPKILTWLCLLALVFCQTAAAINACGPVQSGLGMDTAHAAPTMPCHGAGEDTARCDASHCVVGQALYDVNGTAFAALPIAPDHFDWTFNRIEIRIAPMSARAREPGYPPPHFLGRLLI